jgi:hypothetical protein
VSNPSTTANIAFISGLALLACHIGSMCLSFIPFIGILALFLVPVIWILDVAAIVAGAMGASGDHPDRSKALVGLLIGIGSVLWQIMGLCLGFGIAALAILGSLVQN